MFLVLIFDGLLISLKVLAETVTHQERNESEAEGMCVMWIIYTVSRIYIIIFIGRHGRDVYIGNVPDKMVSPMLMY